MINTPKGVKSLVTAWLQWLTVSVEDQFGDPLDDLYEGARVAEKDNRGVWRDINQPLTAEGTYTDPTGAFRAPNNPPYLPRVQADSDAADDWPMQPTLLMGEYGEHQTISVQVGGHSVGQVVRDVVGTPPNNVSVEWDRPANCP